MTAFGVGWPRHVNTNIHHGEIEYEVGSNKFDESRSYVIVFSNLEDDERIDAQIFVAYDMRGNVVEVTTEYGPRKELYKRENKMVPAFPFLKAQALSLLFAKSQEGETKDLSTVVENIQMER